MRAAVRLALLVILGIAAAGVMVVTEEPLPTAIADDGIPPPPSFP